MNNPDGKDCRDCGWFPGEGVRRPCTPPEPCSYRSQWKPKTTSFSDIFHPPVPEGSAKSSTHYQVNGEQPIEEIQRTMSPEKFQGFLLGNIIKYSARCGHKDDVLKEVAKIHQYAIWLAEAVEGKTIDPRK